MESISPKKKKEKLVSVIMAVYNGEKTLAESIKSILGQSYNNLELIIVDDGSNDDSKEIIKRFKDKRIKYFYQKNSGLPAIPRNFGIKKSRGAYISLCDQDDVWYLNKLKKQIETLKNCDKKKEVGIIFSSADLIDESGGIIDHNIVFSEGFSDARQSLKLLLRGNFITACSVLVPQAILREVGTFHESLKGVDDYDLWLRITKKYGILGIRDTLCAWRKSLSALSGTKSNIYLETEKIFEQLENESTEELYDIRFGHAKNLMRCFVALVLEKKFKEAEKILTKLKRYNISSKSKLVTSLFNVSPSLTHLTFIVMQKIGQVSL